MDHLPTPAHPLFPPLEVPYICKQEYDNLGFSDYPKRRGWDKSRLQGGPLEHSLGETAAFLQEWLYFGLLSEILGHCFDPDNFIGEVDDGRCLVTTVCLLDSISRWKDHINSLSPEARSRRYEEVVRCLSDAYLVGRRLGLYGFAENQSQIIPVAPEVALSMIILAESLHCATQAIWNWSALVNCESKGTFDLDHGWIQPHNWGTSTFLVTRLQQTGWCPSEVYRQMQSLMPTGLYYVSLLAHSARDGEHLNCSNYKCVANNIDEATYHTKHTSDECNCEHFGALMDVESILDRGSIPAIRVLDSSNDGQPRISIVEAGAGQDYVAISHVWSDGLGNVQDSSLPICQISRISKLVQKLYDEAQPLLVPATLFGILQKSRHEQVPFWIDTVCVPQGGRLKQKALAQMAQIYARAHRVLVLDAEVERSYRHTFTESLVRVQWSGWNRRLWTFQELILADSYALYAQFADGPMQLNLQAMQHAQITMHNGPFEDLYHNLVCWQAICWYNLHRRYSVLSPRTHARTMVMWETMHGRTTSKPGDELLIMGTLMGLDPGKLWATPAKDRMEKLYSMRKVWPTLMLFSDGPRLPINGYGWAPRSFSESRLVLSNNLSLASEEIESTMSKEIVGISPTVSRLMGLLTKSGLMVSLPGFLLLPREHPLQAPFFFQDIEDQQYYRVGYAGEDGLWGQFAPRKEVLVRPALVTMHLKTAPEGQTAILVSIYKEEGGIIYARYLCRMGIHHVVNSQDMELWAALRMNRHWDRPEMPEDTALRLGYMPLSESLSRTVVAQSTFEDQKWVIG